MKQTYKKLLEAEPSDIDTVEPNDTENLNDGVYTVSSNGDINIDERIDGAKFAVSEVGDVDELNEEYLTSRIASENDRILVRDGKAYRARKTDSEAVAQSLVDSEDFNELDTGFSPDQTNYQTAPYSPDAFDNYQSETGASSLDPSATYIGDETATQLLDSDLESTVERLQSETPKQSTVRTNDGKVYLMDSIENTEKVEETGASEHIIATKNTIYNVRAGNQISKMYPSVGFNEQELVEFAESNEFINTPYSDQRMKVNALLNSINSMTDEEVEKFVSDYADYYGYDYEDDKDYNSLGADGNASFEKAMKDAARGQQDSRFNDQTMPFLSRYELSSYDDDVDELSLEQKRILAEQYGRTERLSKADFEELNQIVDIDEEQHTALMGMLDNKQQQVESTSSIIDMSEYFGYDPQDLSGFQATQKEVLYLRYGEYGLDIMSEEQAEQLLEGDIDSYEDVLEYLDTDDEDIARSVYNYMNAIGFIKGEKGADVLMDFTDIPEIGTSYTKVKIYGNDYLHHKYRDNEGRSTSEHIGKTKTVQIGGREVYL